MALFEGLPGVVGPKTLAFAKYGKNHIVLCGEDHIMPTDPSSHDIVLDASSHSHIVDAIIQAKAKHNIIVYAEMSSINITTLQELLWQESQKMQRGIEHLMNDEMRHSNAPLRKLIWWAAGSSLIDPLHNENMRIIPCNNRHNHILRLLIDPRMLFINWHKYGSSEDLSKFDKMQKIFIQGWLKDIRTSHQLEALFRKALLPRNQTLPTWWIDVERELELDVPFIHSELEQCPSCLRGKITRVIFGHLRTYLHEQPDLIERINVYLKGCLASKGIEECLDPVLRNFFAEIQKLFQDAHMLVAYVKNSNKSAHHVFMVGNSHMRVLLKYFEVCEMFQSDTYVIDLNRKPIPCSPDFIVDRTQESFNLARTFLSSRGGSARSRSILRFWPILSSMHK